MVPEPVFSFTIPSIRDDLDLDCRIYHPHCLQNSDGSTKDIWAKKGAIVAHPYAPLGGSFDDSVVLSVVSVFLKRDFVVTTFNFRGAGDSKGHTTWTAKAECDDYESVVGFLTYYIHLLDPTVNGLSSDANLLLQNGSPLSTIRSSVLESNFTQDDSRILLVISGYSYGSLITTNLPSVSKILPRFEQATKGTAEAEIRLRAVHMSEQWSKEAHERHRGRSLTVQASPKSPSRMLCGGEESEPGTRRLSRDSRRSVDIVRRSMDRSRKHLSRGKGRNGGEEGVEDQVAGKLEPLVLPVPRVCYLLVSPLLPPISALATMFSDLSLFGKFVGGPSGDSGKLSQHQSLVIYGEKDLFTSSKKLTKWAEHLAGEPNSLFSYREVKGAGHFWHEEGVEQVLRETIRDWLLEINT